MGTLRLLEAIRILGLERKPRFYQASTSLREGLEQTCRWFVSHLDQARQGYIPATI